MGGLRSSEDCPSESDQQVQSLHLAYFGTEKLSLSFFINAMKQLMSLQQVMLKLVPSQAVSHI